MKMSDPHWPEPLLATHVLQLLQVRFGDDLQLVDFQCSAATKPGDNFGSTLLSVTAVVRKGNNAPTETLNIIAKMAPPSPFLCDVFDFPVTFCKEMNLYKVVVPALLQLQEECRIPQSDIVNLTASFYGARTSLSGGSDEKADTNALLLIHNLKPDGYSVVDRLSSLDLKHSELVVKNLAALHGTVIALRQKKPDVFRETILKATRGDFHVGPKNTSEEEEMQKFFSQLEKNVPDAQPYLKKIQQCIKENKKFEFQGMGRLPFATLVHNDLWTNNIMFKYKEENGLQVPCSLKFVDFQATSYCSPVKDLLFFFYTSVESSVLENQYDALIDLYYDSLISQLEKLDCNVEMFSKSSFLKEIDNFAGTQLFHIIFMLNIVYARKDDAVDLSDVTSAEQFYTAGNTLFNEKVMKAIKDFDRRGWLKSEVEKINTATALLSKGDLAVLLRGRFGENISVLEMTCSSATKAGDNYGSTLLAIVAEIKKEPDTLTETLHIIAKMAPPTEFLYEVFDFPVTFCKEMNFYKLTSPALLKLQEDFGIPKDDRLDLTAVYFGARTSLSGENGEGVDRDAVLLIQNLKPEGFVVADRLVGLDLMHCELVVKKMAAFHATAIALKQKNPDVFKETVLKTTIPCHIGPKNVDEKEEMIKFLEDLKRNVPECHPYFEKVKNCLINNTEYSLKGMGREPFATLVHNDLWTNNILFKYKEDCSAKYPCDLKLVDFQITSYCSPSKDILFFLYSSAQTSVLEHYYDYLIDLYFESFSIQLERLHCNTVAFTKPLFLEELAHFAGTQLYHVMFMLGPIYASKEETEDLSDITSEDHLVPVGRNPFCKDRIIQLVKDFNNRGWLDANMTSSKCSNTKLLQEKEIEDLLKGNYGENVRVLHLICTPGTQNGENYGSTLLSLVADVRRSSDAPAETLSIIAKMAPPTEFLCESFDFPVTFTKELNMYKLAAPALLQFQTESRISEDDLCDITAPYYGGRTTLLDANSDKADTNAVLLIRNLKQDGFSLADRLIGLDSRHSEIVIQNLAAFHATAIALKQKQPHIFKETILKKTVLPFHLGPKDPQEEEAMRKLLIEQLTENVPDSLPYMDKIEKCLNNNFEFIFNGVGKEPFATLAHNDLWTNNILFKYRDESGSRIPCAMKLVDFQVTSYCSPAKDLLFFLYSSTQSSVLENFDHFVDMYYERFINQLQKLQCDTSMFSKSLFIEEINEFAGTQFGHVLFMLGPISTRKEDVPHLTDITGNDQFIPVGHNSFSKERIIKMIQDFDCRGWFDSKILINPLDSPISGKDIEKTLKMRFGDDLQLVDFQCSAATKPGDNFGSTLLSVTAVVRKGNSAPTETLNIIAKMAPPSPFLCDVFDFPVTFCKEMNLYKVVVPALLQLQEECRIPQSDIVNLTASFYGARTSLSGGSDEKADTNALLLIHNLKPDGYSVADRLSSLDLKHSELVVKNLAALHGTVIALRQKKPDVFRETILKATRGDFHVGPKNTSEEEEMQKFFSQLEKNVPDAQPYLKKIQQCIKENKKFEFQGVGRLPFATLVHNDLWTNNIMFKYKEENGLQVPCSLKFVDFQVTSYCSPVKDLLFFFYTSVESSVLENQYDALIDLYYDSLISQLEKLDCNVEMFSKSSFLKEIDNFAGTQLFHIIFMLNIVYARKGDAVDLSDVTSAEQAYTAGNPLFNEKVIKAIKDFDRRGWLKSKVVKDKKGTKHVRRCILY